MKKEIPKTVYTLGNIVVGRKKVDLTKINLINGLINGPQDVKKFSFWKILRDCYRLVWKQVEEFLLKIWEENFKKVWVLLSKFSHKSETQKKDWQKFTSCEII